jgi:hypothetical protein
MANPIDIQSFKAEYAVRFGGSIAELKDKEIAGQVGQKIEKVIDSVGIAACLKAINSIEWDDGKYGKLPTLGKIISACYNAKAGAGSIGCHQCGYMGVVYHYTDRLGICSPVMVSESLISAAPCPYCNASKYKFGWQDKDGKHDPAPLKADWLKRHAWIAPGAYSYQQAEENRAKSAPVSDDDANRAADEYADSVYRGGM